MAHCNEVVSCELCPVKLQCSLDQDEHGRWLVGRRLETVRRRLLVLSNKGGVGKSSVSVNLAVALARRGQRVGLLDADLSGPSVPQLLGLGGTRLRSGPEGITPAEPIPGLRVASIGFFLPSPDQPVMWRDSYKFEFLAELLGGIAWGELDWLLVDMPPGTGGELISVVDLLGRVDGAVAVTTPQALAVADLRKAVGACRDSHVPVLGIVENMSGILCPHCGGEIHPFRAGGAAAAAADLGVPLLGQLPLDPEALAQSDGGEPWGPDSSVGAALETVLDQVLAQVAAAEGLHARQ